MALKYNTNYAKSKPTNKMIRTAQMIKAPVSPSKDLWQTPAHIYNPLYGRFRFTLDPCCAKENAKCETFFTEAEDGLLQSWVGHSVFVNPPYSRGNIDKWVQKCFFNRFDSDVVALLPVSTSADWFQKYVLGNTLYFVDKRIRFVGALYTAPFSSVIVHFNGVNEACDFKQVQIL